MRQFSSTAFFCFEDISTLKQFSSNTNPRQLDFFEEISCIAEKSSKPVPHGLASKIRIEENCMWQKISSTKKRKSSQIRGKLQVSGNLLEGAVLLQKSDVLQEDVRNEKLLK